jgi:hypothetical protein
MPVCVVVRQRAVESRAPEKIMEDLASAEDPVPDGVPFFPLKPDLPQ